MMLRIQSVLGLAEKLAVKQLQHIVHTAANTAVALTTKLVLQQVLHLQSKKSLIGFNIHQNQKDIF